MVEGDDPNEQIREEKEDITTENHMNTLSKPVLQQI